MSAEAHTRHQAGAPRSSWDALMANLENLGRVAAGLAAIVAALYVVGAVVIGVRLGLRDLPSSAVVAQLPREFLLSTGLNVILPFPAAVVAAYVSAALAWKYVSAAIARKRRGATEAGNPSGASEAEKETGARVARNAIVLAVVAAFASAGYYIWKDPFPAKVCSPAGDATAVGDFIGETGQRVYIGERRDPEGRRRIASVPVAGVGQVLIGGGAHEEPCPEAQPG
jgi:hypothetical protein